MASAFSSLLLCGNAMAMLTENESSALLQQTQAFLTRVRTYRG
jgi:hypothetical protein